MKIRTGRALVLGTLIAASVGVVQAALGVQAWIDRRLPDLSRLPAAQDSVLGTAAWEEPSQDATPLRWLNRQGIVGGQVDACRWRAGDQLYYRLEGPAPGPDSQEFVFCEAIVRDGGRYKVYQFHADGAQTDWRSQQRIMARSRLSRSRYRIRHEAERITLVFWTPAIEPVGNLVWRAYSGGQEAWIAMDAPGPQSRLEESYWRMP